MFDKLKVEDIMIDGIVTASKNVALKEIKNIFLINNIDHVPILENDSLVGIVSSKDIHATEMIGLKVGESAENIDEILVEEFMQPEVISIFYDAKVKDAIRFFLEHKIHALPVLNKDAKVIGIITIDNILNYILKN